MLLHSGSGQDILIRESFHLRVPFRNVFALAIFSLDIGSMRGGKILGEGVAGCVLTAPSWPCVTGSSDVPSVSDPSVVSKIVPSSDTESRYLKVAARILGPELSKRYLAGLRGECSPANASHPPNQTNAVALKLDTEALVKSNTTGACKKLKQALTSKKGITEGHKLMFISRYPMTLEEWATSLKPMNQSSLISLLHAIPMFLSVLQRLVQDQKEQLVHIDLHSNNIFVRPLQGGQIELGISDFGQCFTRDYSKAETSVEFFGNYLCNFVAKYTYYYGYRQVPLEARLLNFCYKRNADTLTLQEFVSAWLKECLPHQKGDFDIVMMNLTPWMTSLMKKKLFIEMLEQIQSISRKMRLYSTNPRQLTDVLTPLEKVLLSYVMTRYTVVSPLNSILEICLIIANNAKPPLLKESNELKIVSEFLRRASMAPYDQDGSSLSVALTSIQGADMGVVWSDVSFSIGSAVGAVLSSE